MTTEKKEDSGPALVGLTIEDGRVELPSQMSLRDYFAGEALRVFNVLSNPEGYAINMKWTPELIAKRCYQIADAMLAEREKGR